MSGEDSSVGGVKTLTTGRGRRAWVLLSLLVLLSDIPPFGSAVQQAPAGGRPRASAATADAVTIQRGRLFVGGKPFTIRGINYNPTPIGSDIIDPTAPRFDLPRIAALGANTLGTYHLGRAEWDRWSDVAGGETFYSALYPAAEALGLKILVGYLSNHTMDWTDRARVARVTAQFQALVLKARGRRSTLMYLIGNEVFEKLADDAQRRAYATWIGEMVRWTQLNDPGHPVVYADSHDLPGLKWLQAHAPDLDVYGVNSYAFRSAADLARILAGYARAWSGKPLLLHEWGTDSWNAERRVTDEGAQGARLTELAAAVDAATGDPAHPLLGSLYFAYTDEWRFVGPWTSQDYDAGWVCGSCFDGRADEDHWGLARATVARGAGTRTVKPAYEAMRRAWGGTR
jgi:hypothetical protein